MIDLGDAVATLQLKQPKLFGHRQTRNLTTLNPPLQIVDLGRIQLKIQLEFLVGIGGHSRLIPSVVAPRKC